VNGQEVAFLILAVIGGLAGLLVVTSRNVVHAALYLVVALSSVAGVYLLLAAPFVAFVQVIIYVGAIVVLILFGIMLTRAPVGRRVLDNTLRARVESLFRNYVLPFEAVSILLLAALVGAIVLARRD
jgi:NADH-quinone oxidoreductase subunit J